MPIALFPHLEQAGVAPDSLVDNVTTRQFAWSDQHCAAVCSEIFLNLIGNSLPGPTVRNNGHHILDFSATGVTLTSVN